MSLAVTVIAAAGAALLFSSGDLFGIRRGAAARRVLLEDGEREALRARTLDARVIELADAANEAARLRAELERATRLLSRREDRGEAAERETHGLRDLVQRALGPLLHKERLGRELAQLEGGASLGELPRLLDAIAQKGGFASVILSDDVGLPLASSSSPNASSVDWLAGMGSLVLTLVERSERAGEPRPIGVVIHDDANQRILHRLFTTAGQRFLLTAVAKGHDVTPIALDAALGKIERALARPELPA